MSDMLDKEEVSKSSMLIGPMNWAFTLGIINAMIATNTLTRYSCAPRH